MFGLRIFQVSLNIYLGHNSKSLDYVCLNLTRQKELILMKHLEIINIPVGSRGGEGKEKSSVEFGKSSEVQVTGSGMGS